MKSFVESIEELQKENTQTLIPVLGAIHVGSPGRIAKEIPSEVSIKITGEISAGILGQISIGILEEI